MKSCRYIQLKPKKQNQVQENRKVKIQIHGNTKKLIQKFDGKKTEKLSRIYIAVQNLHIPQIRDRKVQ